MVSLSIIDAILEEQPWVPDNVKPLAFYVLVPGILLGVIGLIPYLRQRLSIVGPRKTSNFVFAVGIATSGGLVLAWSILYYNVQFFGTASITTTAIFIKDAIFVVSSVVFGLAGTRLLRWYEKTKNKVVLGWGASFLLIIPFSLLRVSADLPNLDPTTVLYAFGITRLGLLLAQLYPSYTMGLPYYGRGWAKWVALMLVGDSMLAFVWVNSILNFPVDIVPLTILNFGIELDVIFYMIAYSRLVRAVPNRLAKDYYWGIGYGMGLFISVICAIDPGLPTSFPLPSFPSITMMAITACLCFATFTSAGAYFSISEEVKREIRRDKGFVTSIGEAQSQISTETEITRFYNRFTGLARDSGAVEASSITKDEIFSYATAVKRMQKPSPD